MTSEKPTSPNRVLDLEAGMAMVVTDLHGDWDAYQRYRDCFFTRKRKGEVDYLLVLGDMIHRSGPSVNDKSVEIVLDLIGLAEAQDRDVICLLGNHELPHIYNILLQKGNELFTPRFEHAMGVHREKIVQFFDTLPFYIRTKAGVTLSHAGATAAIGEKDGLQRLWHFSHQQILKDAKEAITQEERPSLMREMRELYGRSYNELSRTLFATSGINDPRYDNFLIGTLASSDNPDFDLIWSALFTRNENEYGDHGYNVILDTMLRALSRDYHPQIVLVSGHIDVRGGYQIINNKQLRLASAKHAQPREAGLYLLFDMGGDIESAEDLTAGLYSVFR